MDEGLKKVKRVQPLIRAKKITLDREAATLATWRYKKREAMKILKHFESLYLNSIEDLNKERQSATRERLDYLERGADFYKLKWHESLKSLREVESRERSQLSAVLMARQDLKSVEGLEERYEQQWLEVLREQEQKTSDDAGLRSYVRKKSAAQRS